MEFGLEEEEEESDKKTTAEVCDLKMNASSPSCLLNVLCTYTSGGIVLHFNTHTYCIYISYIRITVSTD